MFGGGETFDSSGREMKRVGIRAWIDWFVFIRHAYWLIGCFFDGLAGGFGVLLMHIFSCMRLRTGDSCEGGHVEGERVG